MDPRAVQSRWVTIRRDRRRRGRIYCSLVPPMLERIVKKSLAAALLTAAAVAAMAVPAGASAPPPNPAQWKHLTNGCTAFVEKIQGPKFEAWFDNACPADWDTIGYCKVIPHPVPPGYVQDCHQLNLPPKAHGHLRNLDTQIGIEQGGTSPGPMCGDAPSNYGPHNDGYVQRWTRRGPRPEPVCKTEVWVQPTP